VSLNDFCKASWCHRICFY